MIAELRRRDGFTLVNEWFLDTRDIGGLALPAYQVGP